MANENIYWGRPCHAFKHHQVVDGVKRNLRIEGQGCLRCQERFDGWTYEQIQEWIDQQPPGTSLAPADVKARRVAASVRWNEKNRDLTREYSRKYESTEHRKSVRRAQWAALPEEERQRLGREQYEKLVARRKSGVEPVRRIPSTPEERRLKLNAQRVAKYNSLTPEEKRAMYERSRARTLAKQNREEQDD